jgi:hypothetical protein
MGTLEKPGIIFGLFYLNFGFGIANCGFEREEGECPLM